VDGLVLTDFGPDQDSANDVQIDDQGRIVAAGFTNSGTSANRNYDFALARYNPDGSLDTTLNGNGIVVTAFGAFNDYAEAMTIDASGRIIVVGYTSFAAGSDLDFAIARYNADGSLDTAFDSDGLLTTSFGSSVDVAQSVAVDSSGRILVAGQASTGGWDFALARYHSDGSLDTSFDGDGKVRTGIGTLTDAATSMVIDSSGRIVVAGYVWVDGLTNFAVARYNPDGSFDPKFDSDGKTIVDISSTNEFVWGVCLDSAGRIVVAGGTSIGSTGAFALMRVNADGSIDSTFDSDGKAVISLKMSDNWANSTVLDRLGRIIVAGSADGDFGLARYHDDGTLDSTFGVNGRVVTPIANGEEIVAAAIDGMGRIVCAGHTWFNGKRDFAVARYNADGSLDTTFGLSGIVIAPVGTGHDSVSSVVIDSMNRIIVAGDAYDGSNGNFALVRFLPNGSLDETFGIGGKVFTDFGSYEDFANNVTIDALGRILVAGHGGSGFALARYNADGSLDATFDGDGRVSTSFGSSYDTVSSIAIDSSGRIVAAGFTAAGGGDWNFALARYNSDGSLDTTFDADGKVIAQIGLSNDIAESVAIDKLGRIVLAGYSRVDGVLNFSLARFDANGSFDTTFDDDGKLIMAFGVSEDRPGGMFIDWSNRIVVAGVSETGINDSADFAIARHLAGFGPVPTIPTIALAIDTGVNGDGVTSDAAFSFSGLEQDAVLQYTTDEGLTWTSSFTPVVGVNKVRVRQINAFQNISAASEAVFFTFDNNATAPSVAIQSDTGIDGDQITSDSALALSAIEQNAAVQYSIDDGNTWSGSFTPVQGANVLRVRQIDLAGNVSPASDALEFTFDSVAPATLGVALQTDTGVDGDMVTSVGALSLTGVENGSAVEYSIDDGASWSETFPPVQGANSVRVRQTDLAGNHSAPGATFAFTFDSERPISPDITLRNDTGIDGDLITSDGALSLSDIEPDAALQYSTSDGDGWDSSFTPTQGVNSVRVRQIDVAGNISIRRFALTFTFDSIAPPIPGVALLTDTGVASDKVTSIGTLSISGMEPAAAIQYSIDNGATWSASLTPAQGPNAVRVRQVDVAGNASAASVALEFTFDSIDPATPVISLQSDTGVNGDKVTSNGTLSLSGVEANASVQYSIDDGDTWTSGFTATPGANSVRVRQTDVAGNVSQASDPFEFTLDTAAPAMPSIALTNDTGLLPADRVTKDGSLSLTGIEANAAVEYLANGSSVWSSSFTPVQGANSVQVRQTDAAGNVSLVSDALTFTLDNSTPATPTIALTADTGASGSDKLTKNGNLTLGGVEANALVEYSTDGTHWSASFTPVEGPNSVQIRQTDVAGNTSIASAAFAFALDTTAATGNSISGISPNPRTTAVTSLDVVFSEAIDLATFGYADLVLQRNGGGNLISGSSGVSISATADPKTYRVQLPSALTAASGAYTIRVTAVGIFDLAGNASTNDVQSTWSTTVNATPGVPTLTGPAGIVNDATPTITWTAATYAARYDLWIDNLTTGASQVIRQQNIGGTSFTPTSNLPFGSYRIWVRSISDAGVASAWSVATDFRSSTPAITAPIGTSASATPTITWSAVDGAVRYDLWLENQTTGASQLVRRMDLTTNSLTPTSALPAGLYRGWIRAFDAAGNATNWSAASEFSIGIPSVTGPVGTASSSAPTITWTSLANATRYDLWVDNLTTGASQVVRQMNLATNSFAVSTTLSTGQYRVWVRAFNVGGAATAWSKAFDFLVGIPTVTAPTGTVLTVTPTITWTAITGTLRYDLWVDNLTTGQSQVIRQTNLTAASFTPSTPLTAKSTYRVWVRAFDTQGRPSAWSAFADFTIGSLV
jgi:uncharacterized delta-60 repeat protein